MNSPGIMLRMMVYGVILSLLTGCNASPTNNLWIIFPKGRAEQMAIGTWLFSEADFGGYWTPTEEDVLSLEEKLDTFLRQNSESFRRQPPVWEQLDNYKRQYVGIMIKGKPVIYGNFFCTDTGTDWKSEWIFVLDGGDCFFQLQFDIESGTFTELTVNGEA